MCLGLSGEVVEIVPGLPELAQVNVAGVRRLVSIALLADDPPRPGEQVLIHMGIALSKLSPAQDAAMRERGPSDASHRTQGPAAVPAVPRTGRWAG